MSKPKTVLFDFSHYTHKYNLKGVILDLVRVLKYSPQSKIILFDVSRTRNKIENDLYCNLPVEYWATYLPHTKLELVEKLLNTDPDSSFLIFTDDKDLLKFINKRVSLIDIEVSDNWIYWDLFKFEDNFKCKPYVWDRVRKFEQCFGNAFDIHTQNNKDIIVNLFNNFKEIRVAVNYLKEEVVPKERWLVESENKLISLLETSDNNLLDFVSYNYSNNLNGFLDLLYSLDVEGREDIANLFTSRPNLKTG